MQPTQVDGTRVRNDTLTLIPKSTRLRPLRDTIIVEPLDWEPSKLIQVVYRGTALRGIVRAVGPGRYPLKYDGPKGKRTRSWESQAFRKTEVKVGDTVELGGLELGGYLFTTILWGGKPHIICSEQDVAIVYGS